MTARVTVLMPAFDHAPFIRRAIDSVLAQDVSDWRLLVIDDGSGDDPQAAVAPFLADRRVRYRRLPANVGLGVALNVGLDATLTPLVAYLPADDVWDPGHLGSLVAALDGDGDAVLAYSGVRHHHDRAAMGAIEAEALQLVQVLHRRTPDRWLERSELVTDDLDRMYWNALRKRGHFRPTGMVSCEWVHHPGQRHAAIREPLGGVHRYRQRYGVGHPVRFESTAGGRLDEVERYRRFRERPDTPPAPDGLTILLVGDLGGNPERVLALEERGHRLLGLWMPEPQARNTVGPLPFGHVEDLPRHDWRRAVRRLQPDVIYAPLSWQAVPFAHEVLLETGGIPFVAHFEDDPFTCLAQGTWPALVDLHLRARGLVYASPELRDWFALALRGAADPARALVLAGELPKQDWLGPPAPRLSDGADEIHTVVPGDPIGLPAGLGERLAAAGIHVHVRDDVARMEPGRWAGQLSRYDAGWLPVFASRNAGDLRRARWEDLHYPAALAPLMLAGVPLIQYDNQGATVATQTLARERSLGLFFREADDLVAQLRDRGRMSRLRAGVWGQRATFTFDHHAGRLVAFFREAIKRPGGGEARRAERIAASLR